MSNSPLDDVSDAFTGSDRSKNIILIYIIYLVSIAMPIVGVAMTYMNRDKATG